MFDYSLPVASGDPAQQIVGSPQDAQRRRAVADALAKQGTDTSPIRSKWQGFARLGDALAGALINRQTDEREASGQATARDDFNSGINQGGNPLGNALIGKPSAVTSQSLPPTADASAPRGYRNNNPLNIEAGNFTQGQPGFAGSDGRFAKFENMDQGTGAANKLLDTYQNKYGLNTVAGIIGRWAPAGDGNNVSAYAADVAKQMGIGPNDPIPPQMRTQLINAMAQHENGRPMPTQGTAPVQIASLDPSAGVAPQGAAPQAAAVSPQGMPPQATPPAAPMPQQAAAPPVQVAQNGGQPPMQPQPQQPQFDPKKLMAVLSNPYATPAQQQIASAMLQAQMKQQMTPPELKMQKDMMGQEHPYIWDPVKRTYTAMEQGGSQTALPPDASKDDILAAAEKQYPGVSNRVEQLYRGEGGMPNGRSNKIDGPAMQLIQQVHPDWNQQMWAAKSKMQTGLANTSPTALGGRLIALRNTFDHLANTSDAALKKGNWDLGVDTLSAPANYLGSRSTSQRDISNQIEREALTYGGERTKFLTGGEGAESDRHAFFKALAPDTSAPAAMAGAIEGEHAQNKSALLNQEQQIRETLGDDYLKKRPIVTPEVRAAIERTEKNIERLRGDGKSDAKTAAPKQDGPSVGLVQDGYRFKGGDPGKPESWEKVK